MLLFMQIFIQLYTFFPFKKKNLLKKSLLYSNIPVLVVSCVHYLIATALQKKQDTGFNYFHSLKEENLIFWFQVHLLAVMGAQQLSPLLKMQHWTLQTKESWSRRGWKECGCTGCNYSLVLTEGNYGSPKKSHLPVFTFKVQIIFAVSSIRSASLLREESKVILSLLSLIPNLYHFLVLLNTEES